jgi:hypothetical protein
MEILAAILFSFFFTQLHQFHIKWKIDFKPFNCASCLASWISITLFFLPDIVTNAFIAMFGAGVLAPLFSRIFDKLYYVWIK